MATQHPIQFKRSTSFSEIQESDIIYDIIDSGDESDNQQLARTESVPNLRRVNLPPKPLAKPLLKPPPNSKHSLLQVLGSQNKDFDISELVNESIVKLPVVVEIVVGNYGGEENSTFGCGEKYLLCYKTDTCYVSCANSEGHTFDIPVTSRYEVALVNFENEFTNKKKVTAENIIEMPHQPSRIVANCPFQINNIKIEKSQILEVVRTGYMSADRKNLKVHTLSGEEIIIPKTLKQTFSCSIKTKNESLPIAIENCLFPQRVILTDTVSSQVIRKQMCTLVKCMVKKTFLARLYTDEYSSIPTEDSLIEIPVNMKLTVKIVGKPKDTSVIHEILKSQSRKSPNEIKAKALGKLPARPPKPLTRCRSEVRINRATTQLDLQSETNEPSTPQPEKKEFFHPPEKKTLSPPSVKKTLSPPSVKKPLNSPSVKKSLNSPSVKKPLSPPSIKKPLNPPFEKKPMMPFSISKTKLASRSSFCDAVLGADSKAPEIKKKQLAKLESEIKSLEEVNTNLKTELAEEKKRSASLVVRIASLEKSLEEANSTISSNDTSIRNLLLAKRTLPSLPNNPGSAPTSPLLQHKAEFSSEYSTNRMNLANPPAKPSKILAQSHYQQPRDLLKSPTVESGEFMKGTQTVEDMKTILHRINLSQYENQFIKEGINMEILGSLNEDILEKNLKIKNVLHRKKLLKLAEKVRNKEDISNFYVDPQILIGAAKKNENEKLYQALD